ncbi:DUF4249 family protein [Marinilabiliaceae bacterium JC017]|nr:DUF4249 family protein [Marinilabiliaceae bacterium JC017]
MHIRLFSCLLLVAACFGCISDYKGDYPLSEQVPVVNGVLFADSAIAVNLSWSGHPDQKNFKPITDASVEVLEDGQSIGEATVTEKGVYRFNHIAQASTHYSLNVQLPGREAISAATTIPSKPAINCTQTDDRHIVELDISNINDTIHAFYILMFYKYHLNDEWEQEDGIYCNSILVDPCNRALDTSGPANLIYLHDMLIRCPAENFINKAGTLTISAFSGAKYSRIYILSATKAFDLYFKAAFWQRYYDPNIQLPFTYQAIHLPSNVEGSPGIFAGTDVTYFEFLPEDDENTSEE